MTTNRPVSRVRSAVRAALKEAPDGRIVVAFSGGPDSTCLLDALASLAPDRIAGACFVDHGLRPETQAELAVVTRTASALDIEILACRVDTRSHAGSHRLSIESSARELRYRELRGAAGKTGASLIATGHTANDQVETVLMHEFRGSGIAGLAGMASVKGDIFRPLLSLTHEETVAYCQARELEFVTDLSNEAPEYQRNRVRHEIVPAIDAVYPQAGRSIQRLAESAAADATYLEGLAGESLPLVTRQGVILPELWAALPDSVRYHLLRVIRLKTGEDVSAEALTEDWSRLSKAVQARRDRPVRVQALPPLLRAERSGSIPLRTPGRTKADGVIFDAALVRMTDDVRTEVKLAEGTAYFDHGKIGRLSARSWLVGDRMRPLGSPGRRKLQDIFVDRRVPEAVRHRIPVVVSDDTVVWLPGIAVAQDAAVDPETREVLYVTVGTVLPRRPRPGIERMR